MAENKNTTGGGMREIVVSYFMALIHPLKEQAEATYGNGSRCPRWIQKTTFIRLVVITRFLAVFELSDIVHEMLVDRRGGVGRVYYSWFCGTVVPFAAIQLLFPGTRTRRLLGRGWNCVYTFLKRTQRV